MSYRAFIQAMATAAVAVLAAAPQSARAGAGARRDFTEVPIAASQTQYAIVTLHDPPVARYQGGIGNLKRTQPARGQKLNPKAADVAAYVGYLKSTHANYRAFLGQATPRAQVVRELLYTGNAIAVRLNGETLDSLGRGPGVRDVSYSTLYQPSMNASVVLIGASDIWPALGGRAHAGSGIKAGIIDSGIDDSHFFFRCKPSIGHKVYASGVAFFDPAHTIVSEHGTHVAGTVGGCVVQAPLVGTISGIAPAVTLADYNVFPGFGAGFVAFGGSAFSHDIANALEDTVLDGIDVVNMSLGGGVQGPHDFLADVVNATVDAGLVVAVAAGNSGPGDMTVESPGSAANALTAGASTNSHAIGVVVNVTARGVTERFVGAEGDFDPFAASPAHDVALADWAATGGDVTACLAAPRSAPVVGKVAVIKRGVCSFTTKVRNAQNAGAFGVVVYNNVAGPPVAMGQDGTTPVPTIPAVMVSDVDGATILGLLPATTTIVGPGVEVSAQPDVLAGFSSRGPTPFTFLIKPDVTAPGVNVFSSVFGNQFAMFQGTSMATPHLTGAAALLVQMHPDWSPFDVKSAIVNTADRVVTFGAIGDPGVLARGNGRVNVRKAAATPVALAPVSVSFGFHNGNAAVLDRRSVALRNVTGSPQNCTATVSGPFVSVSSSNVSLAPGATAALDVSFSAGNAATAPSGDYTGDLTLNCGGTVLLSPWWARIDREAKP